MASYNLFNYTFRPAKSIERKLFVELLKELYGVVNAKSCTYIGFGAIFFADFRMIHKELGIKKMINIEANEDDKDRFKFNKPFACIDLQWGTSTEVLPTLDWNGKKIIWMDYDESLQTYMFEDVETIFSSIEPGSFYFFTSNATLQKFYDRASNSHRLAEFENEFDGLTPFGMTAAMLTAAQCPFLIRDMLLTQINHVLAQRNAVLDPSDKLVFNQLLFITYKDNAPMFSYGGYLTKRSEVQNLRAKGIFLLPYVKTGNEKLDIQSPVLTNSEIDLINTYLPKGKQRFLSLAKMRFIPEEDKERYYNVYRYYPSFVEVRD